MIADIIPPQAWISWTNTILEITLIARLGWLRLWAPYKALVAFLVCDIARDLCLGVCAKMDDYVGNGTYAFWWAVTAPALWITLALAVLELFRRIYELFRGDPHGRTLLTVALLLGSGASLCISLAMIDQFGPLAGWQDAVRVGCRAVASVGAATLLVQIAYLSIAKVQLAHNVTIHRVAFTIFLCAEASLRYITAMQNAQVAAYADLAASMCFTVALLIWLFGFRKGGEESGPPPQKSQTELERAARKYERMKRYLDDLNGRLSGRR
jgi:hypothetical protein